jgi:hypothetical protein
MTYLEYRRWKLDRFFRTRLLITIRWWPWPITISVKRFYA